MASRFDLPGYDTKRLQGISQPLDHRMEEDKVLLRYLCRHPLRRQFLKTGIDLRFSEGFFRFFEHLVGDITTAKRMPLFGKPKCQLPKPASCIPDLHRLFLMQLLQILLQQFQPPLPLDAAIDPVLEFIDQRIKVLIIFPALFLFQFNTLHLFIKNKQLRQF